jgi:transcriptional regulator with XRE-family HTH domain
VQEAVVAREVGRQVRRLRREQELTQGQVAQKAGLNLTTVSHVETGTVSPTVETLEKLAHALDVGVVELFPKAQAPSEGGFSEREIALAQAYLEQRRNAHRLLSVCQHIANATASSWEELGRELSLDEVRRGLGTLEAMVNAGIIEIRRHKHNDLVDEVVDTRAQDHMDEHEMEMLHTAMTRLRRAAEPVFEREHARRERSRFEVIEGALAASSPAA